MLDELRRAARRVSLSNDLQWGHVPRPFFRYHRPDPADPSEVGMHFIAFGFEMPPVDWWLGVEIDLAPAEMLDAEEAEVRG